MPSYWGLDGQLVDGRFELASSNVKQPVDIQDHNLPANKAIPVYETTKVNTGGTALPSAARTTNGISGSLTNASARGVMVLLDITAASGTGGLAMTIRGKDPVTGKDVNLLVDPTAIVAIGTYGFEVYPGSTTAGNTTSGGHVRQRVSGSLPKDWFIRVNHGDATSYTYSVGYQLIV